MSRRLRLGQISIIYSASRIVASAFGFGATVYIARLLGGEALGVYSLTLTTVSWICIPGTMGITGGIKKRVSEQEEPTAYVVAGAIMMITLFMIAGGAVFLFQDQVNKYVGYPVAGYLVVILGVTLIYNVITATLNGQHLVHIAGVLSPVKTGSRAGIQITALAAGLGLAGLFSGYVVGYLIVIFAGGVVVVRNFETLTIPRRRHFQRIVSFAKYAWLGGLRGTAFNWVDIALLGAFVPTALVGYYTAAWNIAQFLIIFGAGVSQTLFPRMSESASSEDPEVVADLLNTALSFAGLIMIPGLIGSILIGERLLQVYGSEFTQASLVLSILILATLLQSYQKQLTTTLNALDRPDKAFRINLVFILANVFLNLIFITTYGFVGAAIATAASVAVSLVVAYRSVDSLLEFHFPTGEIVRQWIATGIMSTMLVALLWVESVYPIWQNIVVVLTLVTVGSLIYFFALLVLSARFRLTIRDNMPNSILHLG